MITTLPKSVSADDLATLLGVTKRSVNSLAERKILRRLPKGQFDLVENVVLYIAWRETVIAKEAGAGPYGEARAALTLEKAKVARIQREKLEGTLVALKEVQMSEAMMATIIKAKVLAGHSVLAPRVAGKSVIDCAAIIKKRDEEICEAIADFGNPNDHAFSEALHAGEIQMECEACGETHALGFIESRKTGEK
jgi:uncharacterized protein YdbL (DUF1318 family)